MKQGDKIKIQATVLRVDGDFLHAQTLSGQLIQTDISNCVKEEKEAEKIEKPTGSSIKSVSQSENKAVLDAPENKSVQRKK